MRWYFYIPFYDYKILCSIVNYIFMIRKLNINHSFSFNILKISILSFSVSSILLTNSVWFENTLRGFKKIINAIRSWSLQIVLLKNFTFVYYIIKYIVTDFEYNMRIIIKKEYSKFKFLVWRLYEFRKSPIIYLYKLNLKFF